MISKICALNTGTREMAVVDCDRLTNSIRLYLEYLNSALNYQNFAVKIFEHDYVEMIFFFGQIVRP